MATPGRMRPGEARALLESIPGDRFQKQAGFKAAVKRYPRPSEMASLYRDASFLRVDVRVEATTPGGAELWRPGRAGGRPTFTLVLPGRTHAAPGGRRVPLNAFSDMFNRQRLVRITAKSKVDYIWVSEVPRDRGQVVFRVYAMVEPGHKGRSEDAVSAVADMLPEYDLREVSRTARVVTYRTLSDNYEKSVWNPDAPEYRPPAGRRPLNPAATPFVPRAAPM
jgi:hypothetical protein